MLKIDIYNHVFPESYWELMLEVAGDYKDMGKRVRDVPMLMDLDERFRVMDMFGEDYKQVLSLASPPLEVLAKPADAVRLARAANDGMAALVDQHPDRFPGFVASLAMNDTEAMLAETHRAIKDLGAVGVQIFTNVNGKPLDRPEFFPLFEAMAEYDLPVWVHPARGANMPDYLSEDRSAYEIWWTFGWPYETSVFMAHMVFSKVLQRLPNLKFITHHLGGMVPYFEGRVGPGWDQLGKRTTDEDYTKVLEELDKPHLEYFKDFYADTATFGSTSATKCGLDFFGVDKVVFASDAPFDPEKGPMYIRETIKVLDNLGLPEADLAKIYHGNAQRLLRLPTN
jgi:aminocarboxymuconate-semialdehyde decarboxylase